VAINGENDAVRDPVASHNVWIDGDDAFDGSASVHRVSSYEGGVSKQAGASLPIPAGMPSTARLNLSLLGANVSPNDCLQGQAGDCYLIGLLASLANTTPSAITGSLVDMGDGTYVVRFYAGGDARYYRVSNQFASIGEGIGRLYYAGYGAANTIWVPVIEKAFAYFRRGENTYASINGGSFGEVYDALGIQSSTFNPASYTDAQLFTALSSRLAAGKSVAFATTLTPLNLVQAHAYSLLSVANVNGVYKYTVRNPWGCKGRNVESSTGIAVLTYAQMLANFAGGTWAA
jgi:Calpain family cysteine protease